MKITTIALLLFVFMHSFCLSLPTYYPHSKIRSNLIKDPYGHGEYLNSKFTSHIKDKKINYILEIGSRDAIDAVRLSKYYHCHVYAFECNPEAIEICKFNIGSYKNVTLVPEAAWDTTGIISFHPVIEGGEVFCRGSSSIFEFNPEGPVKNKQKQGTIEVPAIRLDDWLEKNQLYPPFLICMDTQGATLPILKGLGEKIRGVKFIITEVDLAPYYLGEALYPEIRNFLEEKGFKEYEFIDHDGEYADALYINEACTQNLIRR